MLPAARQGMQIDGFSYDLDGFFVGFLLFLRFDIMKRQQLMMEEKHPGKRKTSVEPFSLRPARNAGTLQLPNDNDNSGHQLPLSKEHGMGDQG